MKDPKLTDRQAEVMRLICERGKTDKEVAAELGLSVGTAKVHVRMVLKATGTRSKVDLVRWFYTQRTTPFDLVTRTNPVSSLRQKNRHTQRK